jgi:GAF domain-containing protein
VHVLGEVSASRDPEARRTALRVLVSAVVDIAQSQIGTISRPDVAKRQSKPRIRSNFYAFSDSDTLKLVMYFPRNDSPRQDFVRGRSYHDDDVIDLAARSRQVRMVPDLLEVAPPYFEDAPGRSYRSLIAVPVRAGQRSFGLLNVDCDQPHMLTDVDVGFMILLAGVLAAGLAQWDGSLEPDIIGISTEATAE